MKAGHSLQVKDSLEMGPFDWLLWRSDRYYDGEVLVSLLVAAGDAGADDRFFLLLWDRLTHRAITHLDEQTILRGLKWLREAGKYPTAIELCLSAISGFMRADKPSPDGSSKIEAGIHHLMDELVLNVRYKQLSNTINEPSELHVLASGSEFAPNRKRATVPQGTGAELQSETVLGRLIGSTRLASHIRLLIDHDFDLAGYRDSRQRNALWPLLQSLYTKDIPEQISALTDAGVDLNHRDPRAHTPLHLLNRHLHPCDMFDSRLEKAWTTLLRVGADPLMRDHCRCSCAPHGCCVVFPEESGDLDLPSRLRELKWLHQVELCAPEASRQILLALIRKQKHEYSGMTHVCCSRPGSRFRGDDAPSLDSKDIDDILDDEEEFIRILEAEMHELERLPYEDLLQQWFEQILESLLKSQATQKQNVSARVDLTSLVLEI